MTDASNDAHYQRVDYTQESFADALLISCGRSAGIPRHG